MGFFHSFASGRNRKIGIHLRRVQGQRKIGENLEEEAQEDHRKGDQKHSFPLQDILPFCENCAAVRGDCLSCFHHPDDLSGIIPVFLLQTFDDPFPPFRFLFSPGLRCISKSDPGFHPGGTGPIPLLNPLISGEKARKRRPPFRIEEGRSAPKSCTSQNEGVYPIRRGRRKRDGLKGMSPDDVFVAGVVRSHGMIELYRGYLKPRGESVSEAHRPGMTGFATVMSGCLAVEVDGETCRLEEYDSIAGGASAPELQPFFFPDDHAYFLQPALNGMVVYAGDAASAEKGTAAFAAVPRRFVLFRFVARRLRFFAILRGGQAPDATVKFHCTKRNIYSICGIGATDLPKSRQPVRGRAA